MFPLGKFYFIYFLNLRMLLTLYLCIRWNSTYKMLDVASRYQNAFHVFGIDNEAYERYFGELGPPTDDDFNNIRLFARFLKVI